MNTATNMPEELTAEDLSDYQDLIAQTFGQGGTLADLNGISDEQCEALYTLGYSLYERGKYSEALKVLGYLVTMNHLEHRYLLALGATAQALHKYEDALKQYMAAAMLDPLEPAPMLHSAHCLLALGHHDKAIESCDLAIAMSTSERHAAVLGRAQALRATISAGNTKEKQP